MKQEVLSGISNKTAYSRTDVVEYYGRTDTLFECEKVLLEKLLPELDSARILDLGVGGGRTTGHLLEISDNYTGLDYVPELVEETRRKFPLSKILVGDVRNLEAFEDQSFDFVLFSFNGLDCISHLDRLTALKEIYRVLNKGGIFMFSSHNRDYKYFNKLPWRRKIEYDIRFLQWSLYCLYHLPIHRAMKQHEVFAEDYAVINDSDHRYSLLLYYINAASQARQLTDIGFSDVEAYDTGGGRTNGDSSSHWLYYLARKK